MYCLYLLHSSGSCLSRRMSKASERSVVGLRSRRVSAITFAHVSLSFFTRSTQLLTREIARTIVHRYYSLPSAKPIKKRNASCSERYRLSRTLFLLLCLHTLIRRRSGLCSRAYTAKKALRAIPFSRIHTALRRLTRKLVSLDRLRKRVLDSPRFVKIFLFPYI